MKKIQSEKQGKKALLEKLKSYELKNWLQMYPVENTVYNGMPDLYFAKEFWPGWIECKILESAKDKIKYRPGQKNFFRKQIKLKCSIKLYLLVFIADTFIFYLHPIIKINHIVDRLPNKQIKGNLFDLSKEDDIKLFVNYI